MNDESCLKSGNTVLLGEWCKEYSKNKVCNDDEFTTIPYHWKNRKKFKEDHKYLSHLYQEILKKVSLELNSIHKIECSLEYWQIIIGPWLLTYVSALFDRWENVRLSANLGIPLKTIIPSSALVRPVAYDYNSFVSLIAGDDEWNYLLYCDILQVQNISAIEIIREQVIIKNRSIFNNKRRRFTPVVMVVKLLDYIARRLCLSDSYNVLLYKSYFPIKGLMKLNIKLKQIPRLHLEFEKYIHYGELNPSMRPSLHEDSSSSKFENFLMKSIFNDIPKAYIEGFRGVSLYCKKLPEAKVILDKVSAATDAMEAIHIVFEYKLINKTENISESSMGELTLKKDQYLLSFMGLEQMSDGENVWTILTDDEEIQIAEIDLEDENALTPSNLLKMYETGFIYQLQEKVGNLQIIELSFLLSSINFLTILN